MNQTGIRFLSIQNVLRIHADTVSVEGGAAGVRDEGLLASAVEMPLATFGGHYLHPDLAAMAAAYLFHICSNHPFFDGNKRVAAFSAILFLRVNGTPLADLPGEALTEQITLRVATGSMTKREVARMLRDYVGRKSRRE